MKIAACQTPEIRESPDEALTWIETYARRAATEGARLLCFPECFLQGYLCEPRAARRHAISLRGAAFDRILAKLADAKPVLVFGLIEADGDVLYNSAVVIDGGRLVGSHRKINLLPGERMAFSPGVFPGVFDAGGVKFGINICADTQAPALASAVASAGAELIVCPANNMMRRENAENWKDRHNETRTRRAREAGVWMISADVTGTRGDSIGLGPTCVIDPEGHVVARVPLMEVGMVVADIDIGHGGHRFAPSLSE